MPDFLGCKISCDTGNLFYNAVNKPFSSHPFNSNSIPCFQLVPVHARKNIATTSISHNTQKLIDDKLRVESHGRKVWIESFYGRTNPHFMVKHGAVLLIHRVCEREEKALCLRGVLHRLSRPRDDSPPTVVK